MGKLAILTITPDFVEAVHVKLNSGAGTWRTKLEKLECLKYRGRINS